MSIFYAPPFVARRFVGRLRLLAAALLFITPLCVSGQEYRFAGLYVPGRAGAEPRCDLTFTELTSEWSDKQLRVRRFFDCEQMIRVVELGCVRSSFATRRQTVYVHASGLAGRGCIRAWRRQGGNGDCAGNDEKLAPR